MAENIVSNTRHPQNAFQEGRASDFTDVASATIKPMAPTSAPALPAAPAPPVTLDPRVVVTPLDPTRLEEVLCKYNLLDEWSHIV